MEAYTSFAEVYDRFMDNVPYKEWCEAIVKYLKEYNIEDGLLLDLCCGTGTLTAMLSGLGFDMIGVDVSEDMLAMAMEKSGYDSGILYLCQDMREFELYGTVRAIISACDSMNYLTDEKDLKKVFELAHNYLDYDGLFIFDMNTKYKYENLLADNTFAENREDCSFIWENQYDKESCINQYDLTLFVKAESSGYDEEEYLEDISDEEYLEDISDEEYLEDINDDEASEFEDNTDTFYRYQEVHYQKAYDLEVVKELIAESGLILKAIYDGYTYDEAKADSERLVFICSKEL